ncbi:salivary endonuclease-like [Anticarsia gemmatalis]|uniref:salivary endonuclease-like n=1 Tax=Anticarsia gemmatalis TaxID=129554 RepID=UPI003F772A1D
MMRVVFVLAALLAATAALPTDDMPEPGQLAFVLDEDDFEDYLDAWLAKEEPKWVNASSAEPEPRSGCSIRIRGDLGQPQPVYIRGGTYMRANGNSGVVTLSSGEQVIIACTGSGRQIRHPNIAATVSVATARCANNALVSGPGWLHGNGAFGQLTCSTHSHHEAQGTNSRCWGNNLVIRVGFIVNNVFHPLYWSCFDQRRMEVLYVWYDQTRENAIHQSGVDRPSWLAGSFFPGVAVNTMYTQAQQKATIAQYVGQALADRYITSHQFMSRGHLAAKSDYVFATGQRATFYFINAAPQWQPFNAGNWNSLEQNLRARIAAANYRTVIYTGTFRVTQLRNQNNRLVDIYLVRNSNQIPVPLYFYKVVYDASRRQGTAFVSINNPYYTAAEVRSLTFCTDRCRNNNAFNWLRWQPDRIDIGYSFCCTIDDFRRTVPHLPSFTTTGLLT